MSESVQAFINELSGKKVEYNGRALYQCVDLVNFWLTRNGKPAILGRNAIDFVTAPGYKYVQNTPSYLPPVGAVVILGIGAYGDVAVVAPGTTLTDLTVFGQNYPIGGVCKVRTHKLYKGVKGFLVWDELSAPNGEYTVVKGDTLSGIGRKTGKKWQQIAALNGIKAPYTIHSGQKLKLP